MPDYKIYVQTNTLGAVHTHLSVSLLKDTVGSRLVTFKSDWCSRTRLRVLADMRLVSAPWSVITDVSSLPSAKKALNRA